MEQAQPMRPDDNSMLSFDLDPELWLDDPEEEEEGAAPKLPHAAAAPPPPVRHFANIGRLPAPDAVAVPRSMVTKAADNGECQPSTTQRNCAPPVQQCSTICRAFRQDLSRLPLGADRASDLCGALLPQWKHARSVFSQHELHDSTDAQ